MAKYACGKCKSTALYREDDYLIGQPYICCKICGNRWPGGFEPKVAPAQGFDAEARRERIVSPGYTKNHRSNQFLIDVKKRQEATMETGTVQDQPKKKRTFTQRVAPCANCGRNLPIQGKGLCGGCRAVTLTTPPELLEAALAAAKLRFNDPNFDGKRHHSKWKRHPRQAQDTEDRRDHIMSPESQVITLRGMDEGICKHPSILLFFHDQDKALYDVILAEAKRLRRDPDQQILWILQNEIVRESGCFRRRGDAPNDGGGGGND